MPTSRNTYQGLGMSDWKNTLEAILFEAAQVDDAWLKSMETHLSDAQAQGSKITQVIEAKYATDDQAMDGFSRLAYYWQKKGDVEKSIHYYQIDFELKRMQRWQFLQYLKVLFPCKDEAFIESVITQYYEDNPQAVNGWGEYGLFLEAQKEDPKQKYLIWKKDYQLNRLCPRFLIRFTMLCWEVEEYDLAFKLSSDLLAQGTLKKNESNEIIKHFHAHYTQLPQLTPDVFIRLFEEHEPSAILCAKVSALLIAAHSLPDVLNAYQKTSAALKLHLLKGIQIFSLTQTDQNNYLDFLKRRTKTQELPPSFRIHYATLLNLILNDQAAALKMIEQIDEHVLFEERTDYFNFLKSLSLNTESAVLLPRFTALLASITEEESVGLARASIKTITSFIDNEAIESHIENLYTRIPEAKGLYTALAEVLIENGNVEQALHYLKLDLRMDRSSFDTLEHFILLSLAYDYTIDLEQSLLQLNAYLDSIPAFRFYQFYRELFLTTGSTTQIDTYLPSTLQAENVKDQIYWLSLQVCLKKPCDLYQKIDSLYQDDSSISDLYASFGRLFQRLGDSAQAIEYFEKEWASERIAFHSAISSTHLKTAQEEAEILTPYLSLKKQGAQVADSWLQDHKGCHEGERLILVGTGPSVKHVDFSALQDETIMLVNGANHLPNIRFDYYASVSGIYWRHHREELAAIQARRKFFPHWLKPSLPHSENTSWLYAPTYPAKDILQNTIPFPGSFSKNPHLYIALGGTVISVCLQIAYFLGFKKVVLLGLDHNYNLKTDVSQDASKTVSGEQLKGAHFIENYYQAGNVNIDYKGMMRAYHLAHEAFLADSREIINATEGTQLDTFPKITLSECLT